MASPNDLRYTKTHEWVRLDGDVATIGITEHAATELGDITYLELPEVGDNVSSTSPLGIVESVKAATDIYSPADGEVTERNDAAVDSPDLINSSPYGSAWLIKVRLADPTQIGSLMDAAAYDKFAEETGH